MATDTVNQIQEQTSKLKRTNISFSIWSPTQRTRKAVIDRLIETLSLDLSSPSATEPSLTTRLVRSSAVSRTRCSRRLLAPDDNGIEILQIYSASACSQPSSPDPLLPLLAVDTAVRILKEGGMDAIKLEGGAPSRITAAKAIVEAGIAVIGHVGLTPQAISVLGGFRPQGKNVISAVKVVETALALQEAGCFSVVLECVPAPVAAAATSALRIPTIGIGAGPFCSGQVLVYHDLLGMMQHPHHAKVTPKFCKQYAHVGDVINKALSEYKEEVISGSFPGPSHSPYKINGADVNGFLNELQKLGLDKAATAAAEAAEKMETAESQQSG